MLSRLSIRSKLLCAFALVLLPLFAMMAVGTRRQWLHQKEAVFAHHDKMAFAIAAVLREFLLNTVETQEAMGIAGHHFLQAPGEFQRYISEVARVNPLMVACGIFERDGTLRFSDQAPFWWEALRDNSDLAAVRNRRRWGVSNLQQAANGDMVVTIATPIPGSSKILRAAIDVAILREHLHLPRASSGPRAGERFVVVDGAGRLVFHSVDLHRSWEERDWRDDRAIREARARGAARKERYYSRVDGQRCLASYIRVKETDWVVGAASPVELALAPTRDAMRLDLGLMGLALSASLALVFLLGAHLIRPVERLAAAAEALGRGEVVSLDERGEDETARLARTFNTMVRQVRERYDREHAIATTLQSAFLPTRFPECPGFSFAAAYYPALREAEVGGDFYDLFALPGGTIGILLGDVSGKGLQAAVYATAARHLVRAYALENPSPADVLHRANRALCVWLEETDLFVTAVYGVLDPASGALGYANAGHWPALLARGGQTELVGGGSVALGIEATAEYREGRLSLDPGDELVLFTDGLIEVGAQDPMSHLESVQRSIAEGRHPRVDDLLARLYESALLRAGGERRDDIAILALRREISSPPAGLPHQTIPEHGHLGRGVPGSMIGRTGTKAEGTNGACEQQN